MSVSLAYRHTPPPQHRSIARCTCGDSRRGVPTVETEVMEDQEKDEGRAAHYKRISMRDRISIDVQGHGRAIASFFSNDRVNLRST